MPLDEVDKQGRNGLHAGSRRVFIPAQADPNGGRVSFAAQQASRSLDHAPPLSATDGVFTATSDPRHLESNDPIT